MCLLEPSPLHAPAGAAVFGDDWDGYVCHPVQPEHYGHELDILIHLGSVIVALIHFHFLFILVHSVIIVVSAAL